MIMERATFAAEASAGALQRSESFIFHGLVVLIVGISKKKKRCTYKGGRGVARRCTADDAVA